MTQRNEVLEAFTISDLDNPLTLKSIQDKLEAIDVAEVCTVCENIGEHNSRTVAKESCKDCNYVFQGGDHIEKMDDGSFLCVDCANDAEQAAQADWQMKESSRKN